MPFARRRAGPRSEASELIDAGTVEVKRRGDDVGLSVIEWARALLYNGLGRYEDAPAAAQPPSAHPQALGFSTRALPELIEAAGPQRDG